MDEQFSETSVRPRPLIFAFRMYRTARNLNREKATNGLSAPYRCACCAAVPCWQLCALYLCSKDSSTEVEEACIQKRVAEGTTQAGDHCTRRTNLLPTKMKPGKPSDCLLRLVGKARLVKNSSVIPLTCTKSTEY
ncbi:hypothetical protein MUK42_16804 [Musa troglodytarum]|uniref:Uncharacterized protein n=1 Tax=Musa troglodytarum TaxID=320322 RepID=A0A9E7L6K1_9LILI|nr:hypothetical protein MUK42_16804 [Musa troglodytarum]